MHARKPAVRWGFLPVTLLAAALAGCAGTPGAGSQDTTSRTLSQREAAGLLAGQGMGMAAPAEINGYPGPRHVLDLKEELDLTPDQRFATSRLVGLVQGQSRALGRRIVNAEQQLDEEMAAGNLTSNQVRARLESIAALRAQLRFTHIHAHMEQKKILSPEQVQRYYELRGREVVVPAPAMPPAPTEPLTLPASRAPDVTPTPQPAAPAAAPTLPVETVPAYEQQPVEAVLPETPAEPARKPEAPPTPEPETLSPGMQDAMEHAEPAYPLEPVSETPPPPPPLMPNEAEATEEETSEKETQEVSADPAYPLTPVEEAPTPPLLAPEESGPAPEQTEDDETPLTPGMQDAMQDAEPAPQPPALPLTPVEEAPVPAPVLMPENPEPAEPQPLFRDTELSPGMRDAMELAEPLPEEDVPEKPVYIAPLEDEQGDDVQERDTDEPREPVTVELDN